MLQWFGMSRCQSTVEFSCHYHDAGWRCSDRDAGDAPNEKIENPVGFTVTVAGPVTRTDPNDLVT